MTAHRLRRLGGFSYTLPLLCFIVIAFNLPLAFLLGQSFFSPDLGLRAYSELFRTPAYLEIVSKTFEIALVTVLVTLVLGYPLALWLTRASRRARVIGLVLVILPFWISILVRTYAWIVILGRRGVVNESLIELGLIGSPIQFLFNDIGVIVGTVHVLLPFMVLTLYAGMSRVDARLLDAAASLGARPRTVFWRVFAPLTLPALSAGSIIVFILTIGFFVTPAILGGGRVSMIATLLDALINRLADWPLASAVSIIVLIATIICFALFRRFGDSARAGASTGVLPRSLIGGRPTQAKGTVGSVWGRRALAAVAGAVLGFLILPIAVVIPMSFSSASSLSFPPPGFSLRWYDAFFSDSTWMTAGRTSVLVAVSASFSALLLGGLAAYGLARSRFRGRSVVLANFVAPMIVPSIITAVALYIAFAKIGLLGTFAGLVIGHTLLGVPFVVLFVMPAVESFDLRVEQVARSLGATRWQAIRRVVAPNIMPSVLSAWFAAFIVSFDEVIVAIFVSGSLQTIPKRMFTELSLAINPTITVVSTLLIALTTVAAGLVFLVGSQRMHARSP